MLSLKRHIVIDGLLESATRRYRSLVIMVGEGCAKAIPVIGQDLQQTLQRLGASITDAASVDRLAGEVEQQVSQWTGRAGEYYQTKTDEVREILIAVAHAAASIGERDEQNARRVGELSDRLMAVSQLEDLGEIRRSLAGNVSELRSTAEAMRKASQDSVAELRSEVSRYEKLLQEAERQAMQDPLTSVYNRRGIEDELQKRIANQREFSVLILDLNGFKNFNDSYGHVAGDDLLCQFAQELKTTCDGGDTVGRLGGDEFIVITDRKSAEAALLLRRIREWTFGDYRIHDGQHQHTASLTAAAGSATWDGIESVSNLLTRADQLMYSEKTATTGHGKETVVISR